MRRRVRRRVKKIIDVSVWYNSDFNANELLNGTRGYTVMIGIKGGRGYGFLSVRRGFWVVESFV